MTGKTPESASPLTTGPLKTKILKKGTGLRKKMRSRGKEIRKNKYTPPELILVPKVKKTILQNAVKKAQAFLRNLKRELNRP